MFRENLKLKIILILLAGIVIFGYATFRLWAISSGPALTITYPTDGASFSQPLIKIHGEAQRISNLWLNDRQIFTDQAGTFEESLLLAPGYNIMTVRAEDRFGRTVSRKLELVLIK